MKIDTAGRKTANRIAKGMVVDFGRGPEVVASVTRVATDGQLNIRAGGRTYSVWYDDLINVVTG